jgi:hypothetical protein
VTAYLPAALDGREWSVAVMVAALALAARVAVPLGRVDARARALPRPIPEPR